MTPGNFLIGKFEVAWGWRPIYTIGAVGELWALVLAVTARSLARRLRNENLGDDVNELYDMVLGVVFVRLKLFWIRTKWRWRGVWWSDSLSRSVCKLEGDGCLFVCKHRYVIDFAITPGPEPEIIRDKFHSFPQVVGYKSCEDEILIWY